MDDLPYEIVESSTGRWRWVVRRPELSARGLGPAFVSFETRAEAAEDFEVQCKGQLDNTGRWVLSKEHLRRLVQTIALPCDECNDFYFGGVYWHERDPEGCNWSVSTLRGTGDHDGCMACIQPAAIELRRRYSIPDER